MIRFVRNWKVRNKLFAGFGLILFFLSVLCGYVLVATANIRQDVRKVELRYFVGTNLSSKIHEEILKVHYYLLDYIIEKSPKTEKDFKIHSQKVQVLLEEFEDLIQYERTELANLKEFEAAYDQYASFGRKLMQYGYTQQKDVFTQEEPKLNKLKNDAEGRLQDIQDEDIAAHSQALANIDYLSKRMQFIALLMFLSMGSAGFLISLGLTQAMVRQISSLVSGTQSIVDGNYEQLVPEDSRDELGSLARSFNWMAKHIKDTTVSKTELEKTVVALETEVGGRRKAEEDLRRNYTVSSSLNAFLRLSLTNATLDELLETALHLLISVPIFRFESKGAIFLAEGHTLIMKAQKNLSPHLLKECSILQFGKCHCGKAALTKMTQFVNDLGEEHEVRYDGIKPHGHYCVPILFGEQLLGVINVYIAAHEPYSVQSEEFLKAVANVLANVIFRKRSEIALKKSEANLMQAQRVAQMGSWEWRSDTNELFWSEQACTLFERKPDEMPFSPQALLEAIHPDERGLFEDLYSTKTKDLRPTFAIDHRILLARGRERHVRMEGERVFEKGGSLLRLVGTIHDITIQKEVEKSQRLVQLGILVARVAHEVNNPLMVVSGHAQLALMDEISNPELKRDLEVIVNECDRAKNIIQRLLSFSKPSKGEEVELDINEIVEEVVLLVEHQYSLENVTIKREYAKELPLALLDRKGLQEVVINLLNNAQDAIEDKGQIEIKTSCEDKFLRIDIKDSGRGMSEEVIAKIFDPFFSTKPMGTGLGLSVSYSILKGLGGDLKFQSAPGKGTTATMLLPLKKG